MNIRKANLEDVQQIQKLNDELFKEKDRDFKKIIADPNSEMYVAEVEGKIIGFAGVTKKTWNNTAEGIDIFVHPDFRRKGQGSKLVEAMIAGARKMEVRCLIVEAPSKSNALPFYTKNGFRKCGYNDRYYGNDGTEQAIFLGYDIKE